MNIMSRFRFVVLLIASLLLWQMPTTAKAVGILYADPGWLHAYDGDNDYYHDPDGPHPNYLADPDPTITPQDPNGNDPGGGTNQPALIHPGACGGAGQPSCEDVAVWQNHGSQWEGSAPGDPLGGPPGSPPVPAPAPGGAGAFFDGGTTFLRIQDVGQPQDWGWADKGAQGSPTGARQEGNNRRIQFKHEMKRDTGFSGRNDIMDFGVTISFRARVATSATGPIDDIYAEGGGETPVAWPEEGIGYPVANDGRGMFMLTQTGVSGPNQMAFSLMDTNTISTFDPLTFTPKTGLVMNNRSNPLSSVNTNDATDTTLNIVEIPNEELTDWHEFWITVQKLPSPVDGNTHEVKVYLDGSLEPQVFQVIMGLENEFGTGSNLGMGLSSGSRAGAFDVDFFAYKEGVHVPTNPAGTPGDYNDDGIVDAADYVTWRKSVGLLSTLPNDPNAGTTIDEDQYNTWRTNFGSSSPGSGSAVPEPSAFTFLLVASAIKLLLIRRVSSRS